MVTVVVVQNIFRSKINQNNIFFIFLNLFLTSKQSKNIEKKINFKQKKLIC